MKKLLLLPLILTVCTADFGAFAASPRGRGTSGGAPAANNAGGGTTKAVRSASRGVAGPVKQNAGGNSTATNNNAAAPSTGKAVRSASRGVAGPVKQNAGSNKASSQNAAAPKANGARAASTQNVLKAGTKVSTAGANTAVPQECQDMFFGCMDAFCMLDNEAGGRCQCNDRATELAKVSSDIMKIAEQAMTLASEGVERIQMGENADEVTARAKAAAEAVAKKEEQKQTETAAKKRKSLDLSAFNMNMFSEDDDDDIFDEEAKKKKMEVVDILTKTGNELYTETVKLCIPKLSEECSSYSTLLQGVYQQKIRSDCSAYANALEAKKSEAQQKLMAAQQAVRDAALESLESENKYDYGSCMVEFRKCVQSRGECGSDFSGCVADNAILGELYGKQAKKGAKNASTVIALTDSITVSKGTYERVESAAMMCDSIVKQCQQANGNTKDVKSGLIFKGFIKNIAAQLYATEYQMASDSRMNCISTIVKCVKKSCKSEGIDEGSDTYDACLSNPESIKSYCGLEIKKCGDLGSEESVVAYVMAKLSADRVDACTEQVKTCLQKEDHCGENYTNCIGLDTDTIFDFCPAESLLACQEKHNADSAKVREYVAKVAQGLALSIDASFQKECEAAAEKAMIKTCGDKDSCSEFALDSNLGASTLEYRVCPMVLEEGSKTYTMYTEKDSCKSSADLITKEEFGLDKMDARSLTSFAGFESGRSSSSWGFLFMGGSSSASQTMWKTQNKTRFTLKPTDRVMWAPYMAGQIDFGSSIRMGEDKNGKLIYENQFVNAAGKCPDGEKHDMCESVQTMVDSMNNALNLVMSSIESDATVSMCVRGRTFQGISDGKDIKDGEGNVIGRNKGTNASMKKGGKDALDIDNDAGVGRFKNLTASLRRIIASQIYNAAMSGYYDKLAELQSKYDEDALKIAAKYEEVLAENSDTALNQRLGTSCQALAGNNTTWNYKETITAVYSETEKVCTKTVRTQTCKKTTNESDPGRRTCTEWNEAKETVSKVQL